MVKITFNIFFSYNEGMPFNCPTLLLERIESGTRQLISWLTSEFIEWCSIFAVTLHISLISEMYYEGHNFSYDTLLSFSREFFQLKVRMLLLMCVFLDNQFVLCSCGQL